jgi:DNA polymerase I
VQVEEVQRFPPVGYYKNPVLMHRVVVSDPKDVPEIRDKVAEFGEVFETDVLFRNRFMIDHDLGGMGWVSVKECSGVRIDTLSVDCDKRLIGSLEPVEKVSNAPLRYLAFDIECITTGGMPDAKTSPIVLISMYFNPAHNSQNSLVLAAKPVSELEGVEGCEDEVVLLKRFFEIVKDYDPDVLFGYNSNGFDFPYIVDRVKHLDANIKTNIGRDGKPIYYRRIGTTTRVTVTGRIIADVLPILRKEFALKQYTLKNTAKELLGLEKHDVKAEDMQVYWEDDALLSKFIEYCRNDSYLVMEMMMRYRLLDKYIALARVSSSLIQDILDSGQTSMVENLLLREYRVHNRVMPPKPNEKISSKRQRMG